MGAFPGPPPPRQLPVGPRKRLESRTSRPFMWGRMAQASAPPGRRADGLPSTQPRPSDRGKAMQTSDVTRQGSTPRIPVARPDLGRPELRNVSQCVESGWISSAGAFVPRFEREFAEACEMRYAVAMNSGTGALHLALEASGIGPGDEVLVPAWTFVATANAVAHAGARPVFVDIDPDTWAIDPALAAGRISPRTKAIIAAHLFGQPADMIGLRRLARRAGLVLVEDASESFGAQVAGHPVGSLGDVACFSLFANKVPTTGDGGILVTKSLRLAQRARLLRDQGMGRRRYWHSVIGYNYAMSNLQAAVGLGQLERIDELLARKAAIGRQYAEGLRDLPGIRLQTPPPGTRPVCWLFPILLEPVAFGMSRRRLMGALSRCGIETRPFFPVLPSLPPYRIRTRFPVAEKLASSGLALPSGPAITPAAIRYVIAALRRIQREARPPASSPSRSARAARTPARQCS